MELETYNRLAEAVIRAKTEEKQTTLDLTTATERWKAANATLVEATKLLKNYVDQAVQDSTRI